MSNALDNAFSYKNLEVVWRFERRRLLRSCFGVDRQNGQGFQERLHYKLSQIRERVFGKFKPKGLLAIAKPKSGGGNRIICVPTISDRMVQFAILSEIRTKIEKRGLLNPISFGLIRSANRTVQDARRRAVQLRNSHKWVYKADIERFFDNIPRDAVRAAASSVISQRSLHNLALSFIDTEIEDGFDPDWRFLTAKAGITKGKGVRQGMPLSPYFAGMVLRDLDRSIQKNGAPAIRYVDDIVAFFHSEKECESFHQFLQGELIKLGLSVGTVGAFGSKTRIFNPAESATFLGMEICRKPDTSYSLRVSDATIQNVGSKFATAGDINTLLQKKVTLPRLGSFLAGMESGYIQAYEGAENLADLIGEVRAMKAFALASALEQALGEHVSHLGKKERRFLGLD